MMSRLVIEPGVSLTRTLTDSLDEMLAVGLGVVITDVFGDQVSAFIGQWVPAKWLDPVTEVLIGFGILILGEWFAPVAWRVYIRLASFGAVAAGIADAVSIALGLGGSAGGSPGGASESEGLITGFI